MTLIFMQNFGYKRLAKFYDSIYAKKNYAAEAQFVRELLESRGAKTVLDIGCGTGTHLARLEEYGFECTGIDINREMLDVARRKVKAGLIQADMRSFGLKKKYDAVICMYATFNHNLRPEDARKTLFCFRNHLNSEGTALIDLHNPSGSGKKVDKADGIERELEWQFDKETRIEKSKVVFRVGGETIEDSHTFRIYSIEEMKELLKQTGFQKISVYEGYGFKEAEPSSKNLEVVGII